MVVFLWFQKLFVFSHVHVLPESCRLFAIFLIIYMIASQLSHFCITLLIHLGLTLFPRSSPGAIREVEGFVVHTCITKQIGAVFAWCIYVILGQDELTDKTCLMQIYIQIPIKPLWPFFHISCFKRHCHLYTHLIWHQCIALWSWIPVNILDTNFTDQLHNENHLNYCMQSEY